MMCDTHQPVSRETSNGRRKPKDAAGCEAGYGLHCLCALQPRQALSNRPHNIRPITLDCALPCPTPTPTEAHSLAPRCQPPRAADRWPQAQAQGRPRRPQRPAKHHCTCRWRQRFPAPQGRHRAASAGHVSRHVSRHCTGKPIEGSFVHSRLLPSCRRTAAATSTCQASAGAAAASGSS
eukprot:251493-Chlamydomonas_euryale.AAC.4